MAYQPTDFKTALDLDMAMKGLNERALGQKIGVSQQAISKWRSRGFPPAYRWEQLKELLGPESYTARLQFQDLVGAGTRLRVDAPANVPQVPEGTRIDRVAAPARSLAETQNADAAWCRVLMLLPPEMRPEGARVMLRAGRSPAAVDFATPHIALDFAVSGSAPINISQPLLKLAALRATNPKLRTVLCLLSPEGAESVRMRIGYGDALGVETWVVASEEEAAMRIAEAAAAELEPPDEVE